MIAGVDGYPKGWIAAIERDDGSIQVEQFQTFAPLLERRDLSTIVIDVPIGLLPCGPRQADLLARKLLGRPRASSVFPAPLRPMLRAQTWAQACAVRRRIEGRACSKQLFNILPKIRELDAILTPALQERVFEGHPEVSFFAMNQGKPLRHPKRWVAGREERLALLARHFSDARDRLVEQPPSYANDVIDAFACLWTARRIRDGSAINRPPQPQLDERGLRCEIVA